MVVVNLGGLGLRGCGGLEEFWLEESDREVEVSDEVCCGGRPDLSVYTGHSVVAEWWTTSSP